MTKLDEAKMLIDQAQSQHVQELSTLGAQASALTTQNNDLTRQLAVANSKIAQLQAQIPAPPTPTPIPNYVGRSTLDETKWKWFFEESFPAVVGEGAFLQRYASWGAYPYPWPVTNKRGVYDPSLLSVVDLGNGQTALQCRLVPANQYRDGKSRSTAAYPRFPNQADGRHLNLKWEQRCKVVGSGKNWHTANLGWPIVDSAWPKQGENDFWEQNLDGKVGAFFHIYGGGSRGEGQIEYGTQVDPHEWFTIGFELIAGKSYKWFVNGKQVASKSGLAEVPAEKVPNYQQRIVLQLEDGGGPTEEAKVLYDWTCAALPA